MSSRSKGLEDRAQHIDNQVFDDLNETLDVENVVDKVLEPDQVFEVLHVEDGVDFEYDVLDVGDEVLDNLNEVFDVWNLENKVLEPGEVLAKSSMSTLRTKSWMSETRSSIT